MFLLVFVHHKFKNCPILNFEMKLREETNSTPLLFQKQKSENSLEQERNFVQRL